MAWEVRERGDKLFDPCGEPVDLVGADVDLVEEQLGEIGENLRVALARR